MTEDKPEQNRTKCQFRDQCSNGCSFGAYFSTQAVTLPAARATGRPTIKTDAVVSNLESDPARKRVTGVRYVEAKTGQRSDERRVGKECVSTIRRRWSPRNYKKK